MRLEPNVLIRRGAVAFQFTRKRGLADSHDMCDLFSWTFYPRCFSWIRDSEKTNDLLHFDFESTQSLWLASYHLTVAAYPTFYTNLYLAALEFTRAHARASSDFLFLSSPLHLLGVKC